MSGEITDGYDMLLQRRYGTFLLLLWQTVSIWDGESKVDIINPDKCVILTLKSLTPSSIKNYVLYNESDPDAALEPTGRWNYTRKVMLSVPGHIIVVEIEPQVW